jgi:hypothetical protein
MPERELEADYLIIGAGAVGMAFADSLLSESDATMVMVDRLDRPGGHWNHAYPFVRLHQPAAMYGVNSRPLGSGAFYESGLNAGFAELASGQEVLSHFDLVMQQRFLPSGRVRFFPMSEADVDGTVTSLLSGERCDVRARKVVDATHSKMQVPATHRPSYEIADGIRCVPPNDLARVAPNHHSFTVIGAGKTGLDACVWLLDNGAMPDGIRWIMPRDPWLVNRGGIQPGDQHLERTAQTIADEVDALALSKTIDEVFERLEATGELMRIDPTIVPTLYHCAAISEGELRELRRIRDIVRLGRVLRIAPDRIHLERGEVSAAADCLYVDCSAVGIPQCPTRPVFEDGRITLQWIRSCQPTFSAALIGFVEATWDDDDEKNALCAPIAPPDVPSDWLRMMSVDLANRYRWSKTKPVAEWQARSRLDGVSGRLRSLTGSETAILGQLQRYRSTVGAAVDNVSTLLAHSLTNNRHDVA